MTLTLSAADLEKLTAALQVLVSPLDHTNVDVWRSSVNDNLKGLLGADSAGFLLPVDDGLMLYSDEHDPEELARYQDYPPPPLIDGMPLWERMIRERVGTNSRMYGEHYHLYTRSPYYQEYAGANGAHDTLAASMSVGGLEARGMAAMHFWHAKPNGPLFGEREIQILKLLYPAFQAGVDAQLRWGKHRSELLNAIDALGHAVSVFDLTGTTLHQTPLLTKMLAVDPQAHLVLHEIATVVEIVRVAVRAKQRDPLTAQPCRAAAEVRTQAGYYEVRGLLYGWQPAGIGGYILAVVEHQGALQITDAQCETWRLTDAERRIGDLVANGKSNKAIASELAISVHTARHHVESVLRKTSSSSRSAFAAKVRT